jgi:double zinc ribbon protein
MKCPRCQYENRPQAKFCEQCATPLSRTCSNCSTPLSPTAKFCPECAHPIAAGGTELRLPIREDHQTEEAGHDPVDQRIRGSHIEEPLTDIDTGRQGDRQQRAPGIPPPHRTRRSIAQPSLGRLV